MSMCGSNTRSGEGCLDEETWVNTREEARFGAGGKGKQREEGDGLFWGKLKRRARSNLNKTGPQVRTR